MHNNMVPELMNILPPPREPPEVDESVLTRNEAALGVKLPKDFIEFGRRYGSGDVRSAYSWVVWNPFRPSYPLLVLQFARKWHFYQDAMEITDVPFGLFPEVGGLLPFAETDGGDYVCWRTAGESDEWDVVDFGRYELGGYEVLPLGFSEYFFKVLNREVILVRHRAGDSWDPKKDLRFAPHADYDAALLPPEPRPATPPSAGGRFLAQSKSHPVPNALDQQQGLRELLGALHERPSDEATWLVVADWLEEDGQVERAELVRLVRRLRAIPVMKMGKNQKALEEQLQALLASGVRPVAPEVVNGVGMRLALIEPGAFRMGSRSSEEGRELYEQQPHEVRLTRPFYLGVFPVTQCQYAAVMGDNPSHFCATGEGSTEVDGLDTADFPVENVSWEDATEFCRRLTWIERDNLRPLAYRLPSEAEWEYSCRGGSCSQAPFYFGRSLSSRQANFNGNYPAGGANKGPYFDRPCAVGSYPPNVFGLYDMHGNIWEWCADWLGEGDARGPGVDPLGPEECEYRGYRGGCWGAKGVECRSASRPRVTPTLRRGYLGFRVAAICSDA